MENDTVTVDLPRTRENMDPNPFYGRVTYTHGVQLDQPLGITRIGYVDFKRGMSSRYIFQPFTFIPGWSLRGDPDRQYVAESGITTCTSLTSSIPCVLVEDPVRWWAYGAPARLMDHWYGTLIEHKADKAGTFYRRNRYYDAAAGRFTQEDPIGLAGGMNLYGFAEGDPVNFADPFGLLDCPKGQIDVGRDGKEECRELLGGGSIFGHLFGGPILRGIKGFFAARLALRGVQAARAASAGARALSAAELGLRNARQFQATMGVVDNVATVRVGMIEASGTNPFTVIRNLERLGREAGATSVRVEGTIANEQLLRVLERRFGAVTEGFTTYFNIPIR